MYAMCKNDPLHHHRFITTATILQEWFVDCEGNFQELATECLQTVHGPTRSNIWNCADCGGQAALYEDPPRLEYDFTELRTLESYQRCEICKTYQSPQTMRVLFLAKKVVGFTCMHHNIPPIHILPKPNEPEKG